MNSDDARPSAIEAWDAAITHVRSDWAEVEAASRRRVAAWDDDVARLTHEVSALRQQGKWVSGARDLLTVIGRDRDEVAHSSVIAWLLTPTGHHGLGTRLLRKILEAGWPPPHAVPTLDHVTVDQETPGGVRRADIIVDMGNVKLVVENKVYAKESLGQCEELYIAWADTAPDVRFLLLSPLGLPPRSTWSQPAADAWRSLSYGGLASALREICDQSPMAVAGSDAVRQYLYTLSSLLIAPTPFVINTGGGSVDT